MSANRLSCRRLGAIAAAIVLLVATSGCASWRRSTAITAAWPPEGQRVAHVAPDAVRRANEGIVEIAIAELFVNTMAEEGVDPARAGLRFKLGYTPDRIVGNGGDIVGVVFVGPAAWSVGELQCMIEAQADGKGDEQSRSIRAWGRFLEKLTERARTILQAAVEGRDPDDGANDPDEDAPGDPPGGPGGEPAAGPGGARGPDGDDDDAGEGAEKGTGRGP